MMSGRNRLEAEVEKIKDAQLKKRQQAEESGVADPQGDRRPRGGPPPR